MAAILPHLEFDDETTELQERYWDCSTSGLGEAPNPLCPTPQSVVNQSHAGLLNVAYTRQTVIEQLKGRTIRPMQSGKKVFLEIDAPIAGPPWNPLASPVQTSKLLSWTTKMGAPSFSLPAGARELAGSCPGARAGQSIVPDEDRKKAAQLLLPVLDAKHVNLARAICEFCYAEGGQYATGSVQFHQMIRYAWVRKALKEDLKGNHIEKGEEEKSSFVQIMSMAIENANFKEKGSKKVEPEAPQWSDRKFFRLHDSGDMFSMSYLRAWKTIANNFPNITFWGPTRIWARGSDIVGEVSKINGPAESSNLVLRPSGFHVNAPGPPRERYDWSGWSGTTTVFDHDSQATAEGVHYDWNCKAYEVKDGPSCRGAKGKDRNGNLKKGCRTCWMHQNVRVNYTLH